MFDYVSHLKTAIRAVDRFGKLSWRVRFLLLNTWWILWIHRCVLLFLPYSITRRLLNTKQDQCIRRVRQTPSLKTIEEVTWAISIASRWVFRGQNCFLQALSAKHILTKAGFHPILHLGVNRPSSNEFSAHAWLECEGRVVTGGHIGLPMYSPLVSRNDKK